MRRAIATVAVLGLLEGGAQARPSPVEVTLYDSPAEALKGLLSTKPRVVAFGEYHQTTATVSVTSAIARFTAELLPLVAPLASDLIVETWVTDGDCGAKETHVVAEVEHTTERPKETESEVVRLIRLAKEAGVAPHILTVSCDEYRSLGTEDGGVDYERLLSLVNRLLREQIERLLPRASNGAGAKLIAVYGGALHNDLYPRKELAPYTFGQAIKKETGGQYLEVDLYVPEYVEGDASLRKEAWFPAWKKRERPGKSVLIRRGAQSYILLFPRTEKAGK